MENPAKNMDQSIKSMEERKGKYLTFNLSNEEYGIGILKIKEIIGMMPVTSVPQTPEFVKGVINLRGKVIPVVNLRSRFNKPAGEQTSDNRIVVVNLNNVTVGLLVDSVSEVLRLSEDLVEPPPPMMEGGLDTEYIRSVGRLDDNRLLILLDLEKVFGNAAAVRRHRALRTAGETRSASTRKDSGSPLGASDCARHAPSSGI